MSYILLRADAIATTLAEDPVVPAADVGALTDAMALLDAAAKVRADTDAAVARATEAGRAEGFAAGLEEGRVAVAADIDAERFALALRDREFMLAVRAAGAGPWRAMLRHILPNVLTPVLVVGTLELARVILLEAALSFLGLGVQPPFPSWGRMLAEGCNYMASAWWIAAFPGLAIMLTVLAVNLLGDWLRDHFDPRLGRG